MTKPKFVNIVVIEDDPIDRFIAQQLLKKSCDNIKAYKNGKSALKGLERSDIMPELILLDLNMPEMNGFEFLAEFEKLPVERKNFTTIYMVTSSDDDDDKKRAMKFESVKKF
ncbi:MAG TPA: response regulator [Cytophagaceae bacterium]|jgi:CheY-like chemotaxis protein